MLHRLAYIAPEYVKKPVNKISSGCLWSATGS